MRYRFLLAAMLLFVPALCRPLPAPAQSTQSTYDRAHELFKAKQFKEAVALLDPYIAAHPSDGRALVLRGDCKADLGQNRDALADYNRAIAASPEYAYAYVTRCQTRLELDDSDGALADCNEAVRLDPKDWQTYENRGDVYLDRGAISSALEDFSKAIDLGDPGPYVFAARCEARDAARDFERAAEDCAKAAVLAPESRKYLWAQALLDIDTNRFRDGAALLTQYFTTVPAAGSLGRYFRGLAYSRLGEYARALEDLNDYVATHDDDGDGYRERAIVRSNLGDAKGAADDLEIALRQYRRAGVDAEADKIVQMQAKLRAGATLGAPQ